MDKMKELAGLRQQIDDIDIRLLHLFAQRMEKVSEIAEFKKNNNLDVLDTAREKKVLEKVRVLDNKAIQPYAEDFFKSLMSLSKKYQQERISGKRSQLQNFTADQKKLDDNRIVVGIQGIPGSYSDEALRSYFGEKAIRQSYENFADVFEALQRGEIDYGILPLENSFTGGIAEVYDLLCLYGFHIVGEKCVPVDHNLLAIPGARIEDIREVYSHPQALQQCSNYLTDHVDWKQISCSNTAVSASLVKKAASVSKAAIGSRRAANLYGLSILEYGISNKKNNYTRFIIISNSSEQSPDNNKLSIVLALPHVAGSLYRILSFFAENGLNMLKIESRPIRDKNWEYLFYIDFEGNLLNHKVAKAVDSIRDNAIFFRLLGNYVADK